MISIHHLRKQFGDLVAVDDLSMDIRNGEILGFLGPNGAGKTTTIRMLCGLLEADDGEIKWNNQAEHLETSIGFCPQENIYWSRLTCFEQLVFMGQVYGVSRQAAELRTGDLLNTLGLSEKRDILAENLSGGMKRRLNFALALVHDPQVLILDEPETGLDPQSRILVRDMIKSLAKQKTIIVTTHNMDEAERLADRVAIIDKGKLLKLDTVENLKCGVGKEDLLEIHLKNASITEKAVKYLKSALSSKNTAVKSFQEKLQIRTEKALDKVPEISKILNKHEIHIAEIQIRKNSLEDVFIHLTGRGLRD